MFHIVKNVLTNDPLDSTRSVAAGEVRSAASISTWPATSPRSGV